MRYNDKKPFKFKDTKKAQALLKETSKEMLQFIWEIHDALFDKAQNEKGLTMWERSVFINAEIILKKNKML